MWQAIESAVRAELARNPEVTIGALVEHVVRATAAEFENDPEASPIPTGTVNTVAAHWREAQKSSVSALQPRTGQRQSASRPFVPAVPVQGVAAGRERAASLTEAASSDWRRGAPPRLATVAGSPTRSTSWADLRPAFRP